GSNNGGQCRDRSPRAAESPRPRGSRRAATFRHAAAEPLRRWQPSCSLRRLRAASWSCRSGFASDNLRAVPLAPPSRSSWTSWKPGRGVSPRPGLVLLCRFSGGLVFVLFEVLELFHPAVEDFFAVLHIRRRVASLASGALCSRRYADLASEFRLLESIAIVVGLNGVAGSNIRHCPPP